VFLRRFHVTSYQNFQPETTLKVYVTRYHLLPKFGPRLQSNQRHLLLVTPGLKTLVRGVIGVKIPNSRVIYFTFLDYFCTRFYTWSYRRQSYLFIPSTGVPSCAACFLFFGDKAMYAHLQKLSTNKEAPYRYCCQLPWRAEDGSPSPAKRTTVVDVTPPNKKIAIP
jgi:hypothetical protein